MGDYLTATEFKARFDNDSAIAHLTHDEESGEPNDTIINEVIDHAEGFINTYIGAHKQIPVLVADHTSLAAFMRQMTIDVARHAMYSEQHSITEAVQLRYDQTITWLEKFVEAVVVLPTTDTEPATTNKEPGAAFGTSDSGDPSSERIFDRASMSGL